MAKFELTKMVNAPTGAVFEYADDHQNYHRLFPDATDIEWTTPRHEVGTRLRMKTKAAGISTLLELETTEVVPDSRMAGVYTAGVTGTWEWLFEPVGEATRLVLKTDYELPMGLLGQIADKAIVERENRASMEKMLTAIKEATEASTPGA